MTEHRVWSYDINTQSVVLNQAAKPVLGESEVLVQNHVIGINPVDWKFIHANPLGWSQGHVPGVDGAGIIVEVGASVSTDIIGRRVAYHTALKQDGSFSELTILHSERFMLVPDELTFERAAALPCPLLTARQAFEKIPATALNNVLVVGFGAVNRLLTQMLVAAGYKVDVVSGSLELELANKLGIRHVYRSQTELSTKYFAVFDAVSGQNAASLVPLLKANGHIVCIQDRIPEPIDPPFTRTISYHEIALGALHDFGDGEDWHALMQSGERLMAEIVAKNILMAEPVVYSFEDMLKALDNSENSKAKTVVKVN